MKNSTIIITIYKPTRYDRFTTLQQLILPKQIFWPTKISNIDVIWNKISPKCEINKFERPKRYKLLLESLKGS